MPSETLALGNATELQAEAREARHLASLFGDSDTVADLLAYASALEADASCCEGLRHLRVS